jgi:predicted nucleotide-binding protein (sugar kinase/HSP70/actin superfamily)
VLNNELAGFMTEKFGLSSRKVIRAIKKADEAQTLFENKMVLRGQEVLARLPEDKEAVVLLGRPYNTGDPLLNLSVVEKLINQDVLPIPVDYLPLQKEKILEDYPQMYWNNGQKVLSAARIIGNDEKLQAVYVTNFRCGPDSFLAHFVGEELKGKPYLELEIDEHGADAGMITRIEAYLDSLRSSRLAKTKKATPILPGVNVSSPMKGRVLYFPYLSDASYVAAAAVRSCGVESESLPMSCEESLELGRKYTSGRECFPMICTTGSFLKKLMEPGVRPEKVSFFMPDHNGPCRFGQYNKFQRIVMDRLGFEKAEIISPSNDNSYEDISDGQANKFRLSAWKGFVAVDILRKLKQERKPYETVAGETEKVYREALQQVTESVEHGAKDLPDVLHHAAERFHDIVLVNGKRKPVIVIVGEIFMRDNAFCSGFVIDRLEQLGAETFIAPFSEWLTYSTYRYTRDSLWKGDVIGLAKSKLQDWSQNTSARKLFEAVHGFIDEKRDIKVRDMLNSAGTYIHRHYDGDPALNFGSSVELARTGISGIVNILPLTCAPGTVVASISHKFKQDHHNLPYENIAYDGQEDASMDLRLQAFMHQAKEFSDRNQLHLNEAWTRRLHFVKLARSSS